MPTECSSKSMEFARVDGRAVVADFGGGEITSDAGALLLGATDRAIGLVDRFAAYFRDGHAPGSAAHAGARGRCRGRWACGGRRREVAAPAP